MRPDAVVLYCTRCDTGYASLGEVPPVCPSCLKSCRWTTTPPHGDTPRIPYLLTRGDKKLLKDRGIKES